jgi:MATE family multidrug resistance protein
MATQAGTMLLGVVDTMMVGHVGPDALGAATLGHLWVMGTSIFGLGIIFGMDPIVTQAHGRGDPRSMGLALQRGLVLSVLLSVPVGALWLWPDTILIWLGQKPELCRLARGFILVQAPSLPAFFAFNALRQFLQGRGVVKPALWVVIAANILNAFLNWCFIYGNLGCPALGVTGSGISTSITRFFLFFALLALVLRGRLHAGAWRPWSRESFRLAGLMELLRHGTPVSIQIGLEVWAFQIATLLAGGIGTQALAAHAIVLNLASFSFMMPLGVSLGAVTRVGNLIGQRRYHRAQLAAWISFAMGAGVMGVFAIIFVLLRWQLPRIYTTDAATLAAAAGILPIAGAFQLFDGTQVVGGGVLRGMGRTRPAAVFNFVGYYAIALPLADGLSRAAGFGLPGIWWGLCFGLAAVAVALIVWVARAGPWSMGPRRRAYRASGAAGSGERGASTASTSTTTG